ncbi:serine/threonine-protein phosphatase with EF-hands 2-like [Saccostrea echinata]|uniref:serine/threonine-protein phosphatase with EF-hands 2-like n=1 Tax=Saccostrea echinata TaxID=191078 RepID=UPI002A820B7B|nr:serine/threonine-protein phosphatase with EF-hands 2-like [Saccostrea echinata]XP_061188932.1 serine/threonine-protein phosphatase with EF-hands 2-like [Saccostrea echinata]
MGCTSSNAVRVEDEIPRSQSVIRSVVLIQKWYRRYLARTEARRRCTWTIFQSIEYAGEQNQLKLYNFFNTMLSQMDTDDIGQPKILRALSVSQRPAKIDTKTLEEEDYVLLKKSDPDSIEVESSYRGVHLTFPLTQAQLQSLINSFKTKQPLHAKYLIQLLLETRTALKQKANINYATTSISKQITVCGDLHGKLDDLYMIFHKNGLPSVHNPYIFNGDFVDRGRNSVEIAVILFVCFLINKNEVYLNRGNHEDHVMNLRYGFVKELVKKYSIHASKVIHLFEDVFSWLPIATIVDYKILVVHGGVSDTLDLNFLATIDRHKFLSILHPPRGGSDTSKLSDTELREWKLILDILWSDPRTKHGCHDNTFRGGGSYFGPDITDFILTKHKLKRIIRSHECKPDGYEFTHNNKVLTIFSASNYYEEGSNKGAYVKLHGSDLEYQLVQYMTSKGANRKVTFAQRVTKVESSAIVNLREKILGSKTEFLEEFHKLDPEKTGKVTQHDWCTVMGSILGMDLPWRTLRPKLARCDENGMVAYDTTFEEMRIYHRYSGNGPTVTEMLYRQKDNLESLFRILDRDNSGQISMEEFNEVIQLLVKQQNVNCPLDQISDIAKSIDLNHDGKIDFNEFLEAFRIVDSYGKFSEVQRQELMSISSMDSIMNMKNCSFSMGTKRRVSNLDDIKEFK